MADLPTADKEQSAAFIVSVRPFGIVHVLSIWEHGHALGRLLLCFVTTFYFCLTNKLLDDFQRDERVLVVWSDSIDTIVPTCHDFEDRLIKLLWRSRRQTSGSHATSLSSRPASVNGECLMHRLCPSVVRYEARVYAAFKRSSCSQSSMFGN